jgi:hypothetical protein
MYTQKSLKNFGRKSPGSAIVETPVALLLLFVFILFPLFVLIGMAAKYACCYSLHQMQLHEAALIAASSAGAADGPIKRGIPESWLSSGLGLFADPADGIPETRLSYHEGVRSANGIEDQFVVVETEFKLKPFLTVSVPGISAVPGLNEAFPIAFKSQTAMENPANINR